MADIYYLNIRPNSAYHHLVNSRYKKRDKNSDDISTLFQSLCQLNIYKLYTWML